MSADARRAGELVALLALGAASCTAPSYHVIVRVGPGVAADRLAGVELLVLTSCPAAPGDDPAAATVLRRATFAVDAPPAALGPLPAGTASVGVYARGRDATCAVIAAGCTTTQVRGGGSGDVIVTLDPATGPGCPADVACGPTPGVCGPPGIDGGVTDAVVGADATGDGAANTSCERATELVDGTALTDQDTRGSATRLPTDCPTDQDHGGATPSLFYRASVPPGQQLVVAASSPDFHEPGAWMPVIRVLPGCGAGACTTRVDAISTGGTAQIALANPGAAPRDFTIAVGGAGPDAAGPFTLRARLVRIPYTVSALPAACEPVPSTGATHFAPTASAQASAVADLPAGFAFDFMGCTPTAFTVAQFGFLQLWYCGTCRSGVASTWSDPLAMPMPHEPGAVIAPYWAGLAEASGARADVASWAASDAGGTRFVVDWSGLTLAGAGGAGRVHVQARLFSATSVIEFHYCELTAPSGANAGDFAGGAQTTGVQDCEGTNGMTVVYFQPGAIRAGTAVRLTPNR